MDVDSLVKKVIFINLDMLKLTYRFKTLNFDVAVLYADRSKLLMTIIVDKSDNICWIWIFIHASIIHKSLKINKSANEYRIRGYI